MSNKVKDAFEQIHAEEELKNNTREFLAGKINGVQKRKAFPYRTIAAAAAAFFLVLAGIGGYRLYFVPTTSITMEMQPPVALGINRFDRVVSVESGSDGGMELLNNADVKYSSYTDAVNMILAEERTADYLAQDEILEISVTGGSEAKSQEILAGVEACAKNHKNIYCYRGSEEMKAAAQQAGLSMGKYKAYEELREFDPEITAEEACGMSVRELHDRIEDLSGEHHGEAERRGSGNGAVQNGKHGQGSGADCARKGTGGNNGNREAAQNHSDEHGNGHGGGHGRHR